jgi:hypothetical protein
LKFEAYYEHKMAAQTDAMAKVMKFNQEAFRTLAITEVPVRVVPVQEDDGTPDPQGFALLIEGAYAAEMRPLNGQKTGCIFFNSSVPAKQIQQLQQAAENPAQPTNNVAK